MPDAGSGRRLLMATLVLFVCDVIGGLLAVVAGLAGWAEAWGFDTTFTVPLPVAALQLLLAWLASRDPRRAGGFVAAVVLAVFCFTSLLFGLFDGGLTDTVASSDYPGGITWGIVLLTVTAVVGALAVARARSIRRARR